MVSQVVRDAILMHVCNVISVVPNGPPVGVSAVSISSTSIRMSWQAPVLELQNGAITSYHINVLEMETGQLLTFTTVPTDSIYVVNNLHPFYHYNCSVAAFTNGLGPSAHSVVLTLPEGELDLTVTSNLIFIS